jgi:hypothetical protein
MRTDPSQRIGDGVNAIQDPPTPTLRGRWLLAARTGWAAMLFALTLVTGAGFSMRALWALGQATPALRLPARLVWLLATFLYLIVLFVVPDGRFAPRWTRAGCCGPPSVRAALGRPSKDLRGTAGRTHPSSSCSRPRSPSRSCATTSTTSTASSRTLTYELLTVVLGTLYAGAVVGLGQALNPEAATPRSP